VHVGQDLTPTPVPRRSPRLYLDPYRHRPASPVLFFFLLVLLGCSERLGYGILRYGTSRIAGQQLVVLRLKSFLKNG